MRTPSRWTRPGLCQPHDGIFRLLCLFTLAIFAVSGAAHAENGIVVWKERHFHNDDRAQAFVFDHMKPSSEITWYHMGAERMGFEKNQFFKHILLPPSLPAELAEPEQLASYRQQFAELDAFATRFPAAAALLKAQLEVMRSVIADYEAGQVYFSGQWMPRADYEARVTSRDKKMREAAALREAGREKERREQASRQFAKELKEGRKYAYTYGFGLVMFLILLVTAIVRRMGRFLILLILAPITAAAWFSYKQQSYDWIQQHAEKISRVWKTADAP